MPARSLPSASAPPGFHWPQTIGTVLRKAVALACLCWGLAPAAAGQQDAVAAGTLARAYFGNDAPWYERNIPFLLIDDKELQDVYYYRWKVYRSHIREIGAQGTMLLEFLPDVPWARKPWTDLNDSSSFHLLEGRWLRDPRFTNSLVDHLYLGGGNTRGFSESIAAAAYEAAEVTGDTDVLRSNLDGMVRDYNAWDDHFEAKRNLYWVEPLADATEYTIASIDASGAGFVDDPSPDPAKNGFTQGFAFRPSINSYQYGNARAIAEIARAAGRNDVAQDFEQRAERLQEATLRLLWNGAFQHFTDRYQRSTAFVKEGDFIRGRELVGYLPWFYEMVPRQGPEAARYSAAWSHVLAPAELHGEAGLRTVEPSYPRYLHAYRFEGVRTECAWNGPSWPFQTSQVLTGLANLLDDYPAQAVIGRADYLSLLRQYAHQHYLLPGRLDLEEDYDPDRGGPIVGLDRSHHYEHSTYVDLVLNGLIGIRPAAGDTLEVAPLLPAGAAAGVARVRFFALTHLLYHGHEVAVIYDETGERFHLGKGLSIYVDGRVASAPGPLERRRVDLSPVAAARPGERMPEDVLVNVGFPDGPRAIASSSGSAEGARQAIDGRLWFFPEIANGWSPAAEQSEQESRYAVQLPAARTIRSAEVYFLDAGSVHAPQTMRLQMKQGDSWVDVPGQQRAPAEVIGNGRNQVIFPAITTDGLRLVLPASPRTTSLRLVEFEAFEQPRP